MNWDIPVRLARTNYNDASLPSDQDPDIAFRQCLGDEVAWATEQGDFRAAINPKRRLTHLAPQQRSSDAAIGGSLHYDPSTTSAGSSVGGLLASIASVTAAPAPLPSASKAKTPVALV